MRIKLIPALATAAILSVAMIACGSLKKGEEAEPTEAPATVFEPETGKVSKTRVGNATTYSGVLRRVNDSNKLDVVTENDELEVEFDWPDGASFFVKVIGAAGDELSDFDLSESGVVELKGGGKFTLIVHSRGGDGPWTATYFE